MLLFFVVVLVLQSAALALAEGKAHRGKAGDMGVFWS